MIIRNKTCMDYWNMSTIERHIMESNVSCYILSIIVLIALIVLFMIICESILIVMGSNVYCSILTYQTNRIQTRWKVIVINNLSFVTHQVKAMEIAEGLIVQGLEKRSRIRDTNQKRSKSSGNVYLKIKTDRNYPLEKRSRRRDTNKKRSKSSWNIYLKMRTDKNYPLFQRT